MQPAHYSSTSQTRALRPRRGLKVERRRVDAIASTFRAGPVIENMAEMRIAAFASHFGAMHAVRVVVEKPNVLLFVRMRETRPAAVRLEFRIRLKERRSAGTAAIRAVVGHVEQLTGK